jgi:general secretion pathway protein N
VTSSPCRLLTALLFGGVFLIGLCVFAPASLMGYALERASGGTLSLARTQGSLWQGEGVALLKQRSHYQTLGSYRWHLKFLTAALQVQAGDSVPMTVRLQPFSRRIYVSNLHIALPVSIMQILAPQLGPYQLQGTLEASSDHLTLDAAGLQGKVSVDWSQAASALSAVNPLGDYRILLQGKGTTVDANLSTLSGKLLLTATGSYSASNGMSINGTAQAAPGDAAVELNELLHHIGPEIRPGVFKLALMPQVGGR